MKNYIQIKLIQIKVVFSVKNGIILFKYVYNYVFTF